MNIVAEAIEPGMRLELNSVWNARRITILNARTFMDYRLLEYVTDGGSHGTLNARHGTRLTFTR
jgi:hypothetical protein